MPALLDRPLRRMRALVGRELDVRVDAEVPVLALGSAGRRSVCYPRPLGPRSVVYSLCAGDPPSFELGLVETFGLTVHAFEARSRSAGAARSLPAGIVMSHLDLAGPGDEVPSSEGHGAVGGPRSRDWFAAPGRLRSLLEDRGHSHVDLLKLDVGGAEHAVFDDVLRSRLDVRQILVALHHREDLGLKPARRALQALREAGYRVVAASDDGCEVCLVRADVLRQDDAGDELPVWMDPVELSQLIAVVEATAPRRVLEWGCGGSTRALLARSPFIEQYVSVEHVAAWYAKVKATVTDPRLRLHLVEPDQPLPPGSHTQSEIEAWDSRAETERAVMARYVGLPRTLDMRFDLVLVDGRARCFCIAEGFDLLEPGGVLVLHDAQREEYHAAMWRLGRPVFLTPWKQGQICLVRKSPA